MPNRISITVNNPATNEKVSQTVDLDALVGDLEITVDGALVTIRKQVEAGREAAVFVVGRHLCDGVGGQGDRGSLDRAHGVAPAIE